MSSVTAVSLTSLGWAGAFSVQEGIAWVLAFGATLLLIRDGPRDATTAAARTRLDPVAVIERASPSA